MEIDKEDLLLSNGVNVDDSLHLLSFKSFNHYRNYLGQSHTDKSQLLKKVQETGFKSLFNNPEKLQAESNNTIRPSNIHSTVEWYKNVDIQVFTQLLNEDGIVVIGNYFFKVNKEGTQVLVARLSDKNDAKAMAALLNGETLKGKVYSFSSEYDVTYLVEEAGLTDNPFAQNSILCWGRSGAASTVEEPAVYFLDETWPGSTISFVANEQNGLPTSNSRVSVKFEYVKLGVFFQLALKGKYDREDGGIGVNGDNIFGGSSPWGTGEGRWRIDFTEKHQGKCRKQNEEFNSGSIQPPLNDENKTRRVFWESDNGLHKYQLQATLHLYMKAGWLGRETEARHYTDQSLFFYIGNPRMVASTEIHPNATNVFKISSNY
ncbi:hypothetical protein [Phnomibacter sp. MR]|uniref:hypothetical protein n=1 Tax=Phnomibacter sp. MR TaxID=3042318 RepID=UPI003A7FCDD7